MKNLGAKLKAAREAMQLSLRDVADATRLRINVLEKMEDGSFDYDLQDVYKRGFLRIYAAFLKLNVDDVMREYNTAVAMRRGEDSRRRFVSEEEPAQETKFEDTAESPASADMPDLTGKYIKLGGAFVLAILAIVVVVMIVSSLTSKSENAPAQQTQQPAAAQTASAMNDVSSAVQTLAITAYGDVYVSVAKNADVSNVIFAGTMKAGMSKVFDLAEPLQIRVTDAGKVKFARNGETIYDRSRTGVVPPFLVKPKK